MIRSKIPGALLLSGFLVVVPAAAQWEAWPAGARQDGVKQGAPSTELTPRQLEETRGDIAMAKKMYTDAIVSYQKALQLEPRSAIVLNKVGIAYHQLMQLKQAKKYYERSIRADKTYANAVNNLGMVHYNKKKWKNAAQEFERALKLKSDVAAFESNLGHAYWGMKRPDDAFAAFTRALTLDPQVFERRLAAVGSILENRAVEDRGLYFFFLAKTFAARGDAERCAQYLRKARDEGHKGVGAIEKDPAFSRVIQDPLVQEVIIQTQTLAQTPRQ